MAHDTAAPAAGVPFPAKRDKRTRAELLAALAGREQRVADLEHMYTGSEVARRADRERYVAELARAKGEPGATVLVELKRDVGFLQRDLPPAAIDYREPVIAERCNMGHEHDRPVPATRQVYTFPTPFTGTAAHAAMTAATRLGKRLIVKARPVEGARSFMTRDNDAPAEYTFTIIAVDA